MSKTRIPGPATPRATTSGKRVGVRADPAGLDKMRDTSNRSAVVARISQLQRSADAAPLQRKKSAPGPLANLRPYKLKGMVPYIKDEADQDRARRVFDAARKVYYEDLARGSAMMVQLDSLKMQHTIDPDGSQQDDDEARRKSEAVHDAHYETGVIPSTKGGKVVPRTYLASTRGKTEESAAYDNTYDVKHRGIETNTNYANRDKANRKAGHFLYNSDAFWMQWQAAVAADVTKGRNKAGRIKQKTRELSYVTRTSIANDETQLTTHFALPDGVYFDVGTEVSFGPESEEFKALLGTPNGRGVGNLLKSHFSEMDKNSFGPVEVNGARKELKFHFE